MHWASVPSPLPSHYQASFRWLLSSHLLASFSSTFVPVCPFETIYPLTMTQTLRIIVCLSPILPISIALCAVLLTPVSSSHCVVSVPPVGRPAPYAHVETCVWLMPLVG